MIFHRITGIRFSATRSPGSIDLTPFFTAKDDTIWLVARIPGDKTMTVLNEKSVVSPVLIGRVSELQAPHLLVEQTKVGQGQTVLISGEAGVGKSRLVSEVTTYAVMQGFGRLQGNCFQPDAVCPYAPFIDLLCNGFPENSSHDTSRISSEERRVLLSELTMSTPAAASSPDPEQEKRRLFEKLSQFLFRHAERQPIAMVIEDIHWSDDTSLEFLYHLARQCTDQRVILLLTYRADEIQPSLRRWLAHLDRAHLAQEISLERLTHSEVSLMLRGILAVDQTLSAEFVGTVYSLTDGNPFFIEEVLKSLITAGELFHPDGTWNRKPVNELRIPRSVQDAVNQRSEQLSIVAHRLLTLIAVIGRRFDFELLQHLTELDETQLLDVMNELVAVQLVIEESADILMDINLPDTDGLTLTQKLRAEHLTVPIVAVTGDVITYSRELALQAGCNDFIEKPFTVNTLEKLFCRYNV
jgi:predicted ATPase